MAGDDGGLGRAAAGAARRAQQARRLRAVAAGTSGGASLAIELKLLAAAGAFVVAAATLILAALVFVGGGSASAETAAVSCTASPMGKDEIPARFMPIYEKAAARFSLGDRGVWVLAAIHSRETSFGDGHAVSTAGALGPMQFMPATWAPGAPVKNDRIVVAPTSDTSRGYATDGDGDGLADTNNVADAIHAAARYLHVGGAPGDWNRAVFSYNHAGWYVDQVLDRAAEFQGQCTLTAVGGPAVPIGDLDYNDTSGPWGGAMKFAKALAALGRRYGCTPVSEKRSTRNTASGGVSDHWVGSTTAYAVDIANCSLQFPEGPLDHTARDIASVLGLPGRTGVHNRVLGSYRFQMLWQTMVGGNHYNHVHIGVRLIGRVET
jgi:hypothetical protein